VDVVHLWGLRERLGSEIQELVVTCFLRRRSVKDSDRADPAVCKPNVGGSIPSSGTRKTTGCLQYLVSYDAGVTLGVTGKARIQRRS
jgi:hypothetical protein